jgi:hypothetical protein
MKILGAEATNETNLCHELLDLSGYVLRTCPVLTVNNNSRTSISWRGQHDPVLAVRADLDRPIGIEAGFNILASKLSVSYPDIGFSINIAKYYEMALLPDNDPIGMIILEEFVKHYRK